MGPSDVEGKPPPLLAPAGVLSLWDILPIHLHNGLCLEKPSLVLTPPLWLFVLIAMHHV